MNVVICSLIAYCCGFAQTLTVKGTLSTSAGPVRYASVLFVNQSDTSKKYSALTDTTGNYRIDIVTSVGPRRSVPTSFTLEQNYPNPFASTTRIPYQLNKQSDVLLTIYDILGREIRRLSLGTQGVGFHDTEWNDKNGLDNRLAPGVYFYRLDANGETRVKKMLYLGGRLKSIMQSPESSTFGRVNQKTILIKWTLGGTYEIQIQNSSATRPRILSSEISNVLIQRDTTINLDVQLGVMAYSLCYERWDSVMINGQWNSDWDIYLNDHSGTNCRDITNNRAGDDYNPAWSPDGRFIAFRRDQPSGVANLCLYNTAEETFMPFLLSDSIDSDLPMWTPDSRRIVYWYHVIPYPEETHVIDVDRSNDRKLVHRPAFFLPDSYTFFYADDSGKVFKSNLDNSVNDFVSDLWSGAGAVVLRTFNANTQEMLFTKNSDSLRTISCYNLITKELRKVFAGDTSYLITGITLSEDFSKLAFVESETGAGQGEHDEYLSILENGIKRRLVHIGIYDSAGGSSYFSSYRPSFSPDGEYIAYDKLFMKSGQWVELINYLFAVEVATGISQSIDRGNAFDWNPVKPH